MHRRVDEGSCCGVVRRHMLADTKGNLRSTQAAQDILVLLL